MADDFCKKFASLQAEFMLEDKKTKRRNKPSRMNDAGIMLILILFHSGGFRRFKHYCIGYVCKPAEPVPSRTRINISTDGRIYG